MTDIPEEGNANAKARREERRETEKAEGVFKASDIEPSRTPESSDTSLNSPLRLPPFPFAPSRYSSPPHVGQYLTADLPGVGGKIRERPEDFLVDEQPLYQPAGSGEHIYMLLEKRNLTTFDLFDIVRKHFGVDRKAIGYAGLKDRIAITRQVISVHVPGKKIEDFPQLVHERVNVLWADYHTNKLRQGHLAGNRFSIRIRGVNPLDVRTVQRVLERLEKLGVPNRFGEQRFGAACNNHLVGRALVAMDFEEATRALLGPLPGGTFNIAAREHFAAGRLAEAMDEYPPACKAERRVLMALYRGANAATAMRQIDEPSARYMLSAFQSAVFNRVLDQRLATGTLGSLAAGDLAMKHENRAVFAVDEAVASDPTTAERLAKLEISPSGPMWGESMMRASGETDAVELAALAEMELTPEQLTAFGAKFPGMIEGARRPLRVPIIDPDVEGGLDEHGPFIRVAFELPRGAFATVVMREIMKPKVAGELVDAED